jgi:hypothetical protein
MESLTSAGGPSPARSPRIAGLRARLAPIIGRELWLFLDLFALAGFVIAQPLLDVLGRSPDFLLFRQADAKDIVLLAIAITMVPPVALWALEVVAGLPGRRVRQVAHLILVGALLGLLGLEVAKKATPLRGPALQAVGVLIGLGGALLYARRPVVRMWLRFLYPAPVVFVLVFLLLSPTADLLKPTRAPAAALPAGALAGAKDGPIVILLMDEFPLLSLLDQKGQIDKRLYPNLARLAGESSWYRNASTTIGMTGWALPSILTGRYPAEDRLPIESQYPDNLFTLLGGSYHYKMHVFEGMSQLCPPSLCPDAKPTGGQELGAAANGQGGFRGVLRDSEGLWGQIVSSHDSSQDPTATLEEETVDPAAGPNPSVDPAKRAEIVQGYKRGINFQRFISSIRRPRDPSERALYFVHVLMPHQPWKYLPSGLRYTERTLGEGRFAKAGRWVSEPWPVESIHQRHLLQTAIADHMVGDLVKRLRDVGLYDRSLLVVTADHGMAFKPGESGRASVTNATAPDVLWVPLFIKLPGQRTAATNDVNYEHVDLVPTIAELKGLRVPWKMEGVSWADPSGVNKRPRTQKFFDPRPGLRRTFEGPANQAIVLQGLTDRLLRPQDSYMGWFKFGPHADLVGRRVSDFTVTTGGGTARVLGLDEYRHVDPSSGTVPAEVGGQLISTAPGIPQRPPVVAAVNGVIGGVSETFASPGDTPPTWFTAMVPDTLMHPGDNKLELFLLDTSGGQQRLHPLSLTS